MARRLDMGAMKRVGHPLVWRSLAIVGMVGMVLALLPASLLSRWTAHKSLQQVQLQHPLGTLWHGSATLALQGPHGRGLSLPGRIHWQWSVSMPDWRPQIRLALDADCCMRQPAVLAIGRLSEFWGAELSMPASQWPLEVIQGLGSPWNSIALAGQLQTQPSQWQLNGMTQNISGTITVQVHDLQVAMVPGLVLGRFDLVATRPNSLTSNTPVLLTLRTQQGPLMLEGQGQLSPGGMRFKGTASAEPESKERLQSLLTLLGEPQGDQHRLEWIHGS